MKALAVLAFFLGILAVLNWRSAGPESEPRAAAVAVNYVQFRQAVLHHVPPSAMWPPVKSTNRTFRPAGRREALESPG